MIHATLKELTRALAARELSSRELVSAYLDRIAAVNPTLNAFISVAERDNALAALMLPMPHAPPAKPVCLQVSHWRTKIYLSPANCQPPVARKC